MPNKRCSIVVADHRAGMEQLVSAALAQQGASILQCRDLRQLLEVLDKTAADLIVLGFETIDGAALELLYELQERWPTLPVLVLAERLSVPEVVEAVKAGASDILLRTVDRDQLAFAVNKALIAVQRSAAAAPPPSGSSDMLFGHSPAMQALRTTLIQVAKTTSTVLVRGESGTGKELVARELHRLSTRAAQPLIKIDCTALPENLIESELFGYEKGAFTGASMRKLGRVELAHGGTLFLDEVGEVPPPTQAKLLRLLQEREFERLGGTGTVVVDVRIVAATHRDLETMVERGSFRQDLFYRLNVVPVWIPPLRARRGDIAHLAQHFSRHFAAVHGKADISFSAEALEALTSQRWPGNVRQLQNFVERLVVLGSAPAISAAAVHAELTRPVRFVTETGAAGADASARPASGEGVLALDEALRAAERQALIRALAHTKGNRSAAARLLGVSRSTLYTKLEDYGLS